MSTQPAPDDARLALLLRAYLAAEYRWQREGDWHDISIGLPAPGLELAYPHARSFGLVSAWNPYSVERAAVENRQADQLLCETLDATGHQYLPAFSSARNRSWREPGWLVMDMDAAGYDALSRRFEQLGALWWPAGAPVRLRMDARRPAELDDDDRFVDWLVE
ncbi:DUF3293 domain-containing protein [Luteimonas sp. SDU101]|uniref:DUF3293 domain-containing protein n=1 Tax=Luteimonas sp. SDU101 TaxID=3422593 RepID=UPI003EBEDEFE